MSETPQVPAELVTFLATTRDARAYRRGLAVKMALEGYLYEVIAAILDVTPGFVSHAKKAYRERGLDGLELHYAGKAGYLSEDAYNDVIAWIKTQKSWSLRALKQHMTQTYDVTYKSHQSYYALFAAAGITYKKTQAVNPEKDPDKVAAKKKS